jgi:DNA polymerase III delta prime subunit
MNEFLYTEKYRPLTVQECILPVNVKKTFQEFVDKGDIMNLLLYGPPGAGKTTVAIAMIKEIGSDYLLINGSMENIDVLRTKIMDFASTISFNAGRKYVIIDEADGLTQRLQNSLRSFIEEFSSNCGFILTCNSKEKILDALGDSRCQPVDFAVKKAELPSLAKQFYDRAMFILDSENIPYNRKVVAAIISKKCPDWRRTINHLQWCANNFGCIEEGALATVSDTAFDVLIKAIAKKDFSTARKWLGENQDIDITTLFKQLYNATYDLLEPSSIPDFIILLGKYQYQSAFAANQEINLAAALLEIMGTCDFK